MRLTREVSDAYEIAVRCLRRNYIGQGIRTGIVRDTYWSWDSFFASFGALELGDDELVKKNLEMFIGYQNEKGCIPRRISAPWLSYHLNMISKVFHSGIKRPSYSMAPLFRPPRFQNIVFILAFGQYVRKTGDIDFLRENYARLISALDFIESSLVDGLMVEKTFENWDETILKKGSVLFTNVLFYKVLVDMSYLSNILKKKDHIILQRQSGELKEKINDMFWAKDYYADIAGSREETYFSLPGNLSAIWLGIADKPKAERIFDTLIKNNLNDPLPGKTSWPRYPLSKVFFLNWLLNKDYHNGSIWLWIGCIEALALQKAGKIDDAKLILSKISGVIVRDNTVSEVYDRNGAPFDTLVYKSENDFAWSSGMFIYAVKKVFSSKSKN